MANAVPAATRAVLLAFGLYIAAALADSPRPNPSKFNAAMETLRHHRTCGACIAAGGAWCLAADPPRCVPDGRGMCHAGGPDDHVGWAGFGRCPDPADWQLQTYLHAPRRPPPLALQKPAAPGCAAKCTATSAFELADNTRAAQAFESCGFAVVARVFDPLALSELRDELVRRQNLTQGMRSGHKLEMPGIRGSNRQELVLPFRHSHTLLSALGQPATVRMLTELLGHPPAIDFASVVVAWPGADAQDFHRDADAGTEAALLLFIPLDSTSATQAGASGPPEICPCTHVPGSPETCGIDGKPADPLPMATDDRSPLGSAVVYDPGLVHRGAANPQMLTAVTEAMHDPLFGDTSGGAPAPTEPRLMLSIAIAPHKAGLRGRPEAFLGAAAKAHIERWRSVVLGADEPHAAHGCSVYADCESCLAAGRSGTPEGGDGEGEASTLPWRTGCAWCGSGNGKWVSSTGVGECVPDVTARCNSADDHYGESGMNAPQCPTGDDTSDDHDGEYEEL
jgi:hypothetical protein